MDVETIIDDLGGTTDVARLCGVGLPAVSNWKSRGSIPSEHWMALERAATDRGLIAITVSVLADIHSKREPAEART